MDTMNGKLHLRQSHGKKLETAIMQTKFNVHSTKIYSLASS